MYLVKERAIKISPLHVETDTGAKHPANVIIYAAGSLIQKRLFLMAMKGNGGQDLHDVRDAAGGAEAYKGTVVTGFPDFILYRPNADTGQHLIIFQSECQINYSCPFLKPILVGSSPADSLMIKPEAQKRDFSWVYSKLQHLVFNSGC